jgi:amidohydrolase
MLQSPYQSRTSRGACLLLGIVALTALAASPSTSSPPSPPRAHPSLDGQIDAAIHARRAALIDVRRDIHRHPEVSGEETRTAALVAKELRALGLQVRSGVGGHGVVAILRGGKPGPVVGYRADMDAVPSRDPDPVDFRSIIIGVRHICGHDVHTAIGLGVAGGLAAVKRELPGIAVFYFQPAEETTEGARAMIEAGALNAPTPSAIFALHVAPMEVGTVAAIEGLVLPGLAAAKAAVALVQGRATPRQGARADSFVSVEIWDQGLPAGERAVQVSAGIRAADDSVFARVERDLRAKAAALHLRDVKAEVAYQHAVVPATRNDLATVRATYPALRRLLGKEKLEILPNGTRYFSEDFSYFQQRLPGVMYFLGASNEARKITAMPHSPGFSVDEAAIEIGARAMARLMADYLARGKTPKS